MTRASHDTLAIRLLDSVEDSSQNKVLTDFSNVDVAAIRLAFLERMRARYTPDSVINWAQSDWRALRRWVETSDEDRDRAQKCIRAFVGRSRKKLAQVINVIYPGGSVWDTPPGPLVDRFFPINEIENLLSSLPEDEPLEGPEIDGIARMQRLFNGSYATRSNPSGL